MSDDELAAAAGADESLARALRGARTLVEAREIARTITAPAPVSLAPEAEPTLVRFVELRTGAGSLDEAGARAIVRELKAVGGDLASLRLALTGADRGPELWTVVAALPEDEADSPRAARATARPTDAGALSDSCRLRSLDAPVRHADADARRVAACPRADPDVLLRADRLPAHPHRQRGAVRPVDVAEAMARRCGLRDVARRQHHRHQRQDLRRGTR